MDFRNKNRGGFMYFGNKNRGGFYFFEAFCLYIRKKSSNFAAVFKRVVLWNGFLSVSCTTSY